MRRKKQKQEKTYVRIYMANDPRYIDRLSEAERDELIETAKEFPVQNCLECIFFYRLYGEDGSFVKESCTINKGIEITDGFKIHKDCEIRK